MAGFTASSAPLPSPDGVAKGVACAQCGALLDCAMERGSADCWCRQLPPVLPVPSAALAGKVSCYCPQCLAAQALAARRP